MAFDLFTAKAPPLFGLDISSSSVKMLELVDGGKGGYRVERYSIEPLARDSVVDGNINNLEQVGESAHVALGDVDQVPVVGRISRPRRRSVRDVQFRGLAVYVRGQYFGVFTHIGDHMRCRLAGCPR